LVKDLWWQEMCFVDDEQDIAALASEVVESGAKLREEAHKAESRLNLKSEEDFAVEGGDAEMRVRQVDQCVEITVEGLCKSTDSGGFSSADIASNERGETSLQGKGETSLDLAVTLRGKEILGGDRFGKGRLGEAVKVIEAGHR